MKAISQATPKTCRFWTYIRGWVRIKIRPGQTLRHYRSSRHDEGWTSESNEWTLDETGEELQRTVVSDGRDCDGRLTQGCTQFAIAGQRDVYTEESGESYARPVWIDSKAWQRDSYAEAMGY